jgi:hypothetical protein
MRNGHRRIFLATLAAFGMLAAPIGNAGASVQITGTVGANGKYLVTGMPVTGTTPAVFKLTFENLTSGTNLSLCAGTDADFQSGTCAMQLNGSGGPGFKFLTIVDMSTLSGKIIFVKRNVGTLASRFNLTVE